MFRRYRDRLADRLHEPQLKRFRAYDLRHYFASQLHYRTKDIPYVKEQLGHRRLENTLIYTHLIDFREDEFICRIAKTMEDAASLVEQGFEFVCEYEEAKLFRKRK